MNKIYCLSLSKVEEYLLGKERLSIYPLDSAISHVIRQIVDLAMDTFEKRRLVLPALPESFSIDAFPQQYIEDDLKTFLKNCLTLEVHSIKIYLFCL